MAEIMYGIIYMYCSSYQIHIIWVLTPSKIFAGVCSHMGNLMNFDYSFEEKNASIILGMFMRQSGSWKIDCETARQAGAQVSSLALNKPAYDPK